MHRRPIRTQRFNQQRMGALSDWNGDLDGGLWVDGRRLSRLRPAYSSRIRAAFVKLGCEPTVARVRHSLV